ncbi:MAG: NAD(P)/FAD-dependent oxidoreductase [Candidatus Thorarchaeota archaeon]|nr:MAG: NAD(P)/FAD-dependent oxidoreductase [Candidatus Thorarchaeota archaeon]
MEIIVKHDAIVIGAGPAGLLAANEIAKRGYAVQVFEEHERVGEPDHCAGLLSTSGLKRLGIKLPRDIIQNTVMGARIYSPAGHSITIKRGKREANVIDRKKFDAWLASRAIDSGAVLATHAKVKEIVRKQNKFKSVLVNSERDEEHNARSFVIAEGSRCRLSGSVGLPVVQRSSKYPAFQYEVSGVDIDENIVEMFYGKKVAPGFFAWIIPLGEKRARIGLAARNKSKIRLDALMRHHSIISDRMKGVRIERSLGGIVLVGMPISKMTTENVVVVGDTAGIVKATTGGGVILGGMTARVAGKIVADSLSSDESSEKLLSQYNGKCRSMVFNELRMMNLAHMALTSLDDKGLDSVVKDASAKGLLDVVKSEGDMDLQGNVIKRLLKDPRMILTGLRAIRYINPFL